MCCWRSNNASLPKCPPKINFLQAPLPSFGLSFVRQGFFLDFLQILQSAGWATGACVPPSPRNGGFSEDPKQCRSLGCCLLYAIICDIMPAQPRLSCQRWVHSPPPQHLLCLTISHLVFSCLHCVPCCDSYYDRNKALGLF